MKTAAAKFGGLDLMVYCVGQAMHVLFQDITDVQKVCSAMMVRAFSLLCLLLHAGWACAHLPLSGGAGHELHRLRLVHACCASVSQRVEGTVRGNQQRGGHAGAALFVFLCCCETYGPSARLISVEFPSPAPPHPAALSFFRLFSLLSRCFAWIL